VNLKTAIERLEARTGDDHKPPLLEFWVFDGRIDAPDNEELMSILIPGTRRRNGEELRREPGEDVEAFRARVEARRVELGL